MVQQDGNDANGSRLSARVVEEAYVRLQKAMQTYRQARDQGNSAAGLAPDRDPVILLQNEVQTFFSLIRPFVSDAPQLDEYWWGALATYPEQTHQSIAGAFDYYREHSVGVWQSQRHTRAIPTAKLQQQGADGSATAVADGAGPRSLSEWHELLGLSNKMRLLGYETQADETFNGYYFIEGRFAVLGLRDIDQWDITTKTERTHGDGFMAGETATQETRVPEPAAKVETGARMLVEVADELDAIATFTPRGERVSGTPVPDT